MSAIKKPKKLAYMADIVPMTEVIWEWFAVRYRTDENKLRFMPASAHDEIAGCITMGIYARWIDDRPKEGRIGFVRIYPKEVLLHVEKQHAHMFDDTEEMFKKLHTASS